MTNTTTTETLSVVVERLIAHPPEKIWRALTQSHLIEEWLMKNDFTPETGSRFNFSADWGGVKGEVRTVEPHRVLSYAWDTKDLKSVVTWTLEPTETGTRLRMEQTGFRPDQQPYYQGAKAGWPRFLTALEELLERMD
ncbi:SRPBCC domain-containing protein [Nitratireductor sp. ZSWI3]|uniref:SRPBCC family protein n=1 Tax=Nitratireductor sp. ZSWI3 TaxID=2966359 RepID=UPI00215017A9|nr:SRPBCC domain-containing protein [Nitratireductor sp. ZSWI3]MCR4268521.1 SRPBCC domain-containing protein [Nitratireductor sp. ZSWI3]